MKNENELINFWKLNFPKVSNFQPLRQPLAKHSRDASHNFHQYKIIKMLYTSLNAKNRQIHKKKKIPGILPFLEKSWWHLIWESHQKQEINNAGLRRKSPLVLEINWSKVTFK